MKINRQIIGERIKERRKAKGLTQEDLAKKLNISRQIISYYETTRIPNTEDLAFLAQEFDTTTDYLLGLSDAKTTDLKIQAICDYTGLSEQSVAVLHCAVSAINHEKGHGKWFARRAKVFLRFLNHFILSDQKDPFAENLYMAGKRYYEALEMFNSLKSERDAVCVGLNPCDHSKEYRLNCFEAKESLLSALDSFFISDGLNRDKLDKAEDEYLENSYEEYLEEGEPDGDDTKAK